MTFSKFFNIKKSRLKEIMDDMDAFIGESVGKEFSAILTFIKGKYKDNEYEFALTYFGYNLYVLVEVANKFSTIADFDGPKTVN